MRTVGRRKRPLRISRRRCIAGLRTRTWCGGLRRGLLEVVRCWDALRPRMRVWSCRCMLRLRRTGPWDYDLDLRHCAFYSPRVSRMTIGSLLCWIFGLDWCSSVRSRSLSLVFFLSLQILSFHRFPGRECNSLVLRLCFQSCCAFGACLYHGGDDVVPACSP